MSFINRIDSIQNERVRTFLWRLWNTVKAPLIVILTGVVVKIVIDISDAQTVSILGDWSYWDLLLVRVAEIIGGLLGVGALAGTEKVMRG